MKKLSSLLLALMLMVSGISFGQEGAKSAPKLTPGSVPSKQATAKPAPAATAPLKKDGTPDKRYKENKKLKKDGTPDKRYKENKTGAVPN